MLTGASTLDADGLKHVTAMSESCKTCGRATGDIAPGGRPSFAAPGGVWYSLGSVYEHPHTHIAATPDV
jgi:hypothetical protein